MEEFFWLNNGAMIRIKPNQKILIKTCIYKI